MELQYEFSLADGVAVEKHRLRRRFIFRPYGLLLAPALALALRAFYPMTVTSPGPNGTPHVEIGSFWIDVTINTVTILLLILFYRFLYMERVKSMLMKMTVWRGTRRLELKERSIVQHSEQINTEIDVKAIRSIEEDQGYVYLNLDKYNTIAIPKRAWEPLGDVASGIALFRSKILEHVEN